MEPRQTGSKVEHGRGLILVNMGLVTGLNDCANNDDTNYELGLHLIANNWRQICPLSANNC